MDARVCSNYRRSRARNAVGIPCQAASGGLGSGARRLGVAGLAGRGFPGQYLHGGPSGTVRNRPMDFMGTTAVPVGFCCMGLASGPGTDYAKNGRSSAQRLNFPNTF